MELFSHDFTAYTELFLYQCLLQYVVTLSCHHSAHVKAAKWIQKFKDKSRVSLQVLFFSCFLFK